ncbi:AAA-ATPase At3g28580 [Spinacia oleracea]|uniref:AAA-ATPase At3g28580 n=1 Tax=Spinacia oleracea TaxID=3562 RepID=A0A9R0K2I6_SPIOL|nr:AAA-ATPase At3g28580-like [Spinacia oleracea]
MDLLVTKGGPKNMKTTFLHILEKKLTMMMNTNHIFIKFGSFLASIMFVRAMYEQYLPHRWRGSIYSFLYQYIHRFVTTFSPYLQITVDEYTGERFNRCEAYTTIETYLSEKASEQARRFKGSFVKDGKTLVLGLANNEEVIDEYQGVKVWWKCRKSVSRSQTINIYPGTNEKRHFELTFHGRHRKLISESYMNYILEEGKAITIRKRQRKLFTNIKEQKGPNNNSRWTLWSHVEFKHPASFDTIGMDEAKKKYIMNDLLRFSNAKEYYAKIGKPWKRGYLLYGPPGTGKSTMIVAIANLLEYDIYDLELTTVVDNTQLRRLLIETSNKSIIVIEDIDCSLDLTGKRTPKAEKDKDKGKEIEEDKDKVIRKMKLEPVGERKKSEVTLSGLLNIVDGIWSAVGEERLIIFTTNHIDKLDKALIRKGRMDVHIELSHCCFESFKVLANNYLDLTSHSLFETIKTLLEETKMNPADVAENLMPKSLELDVDTCLQNLVKALQNSKIDDRLKEQRKNEKAKIEEERKAEQEEKANAQKLKNQVESLNKP